MSQEVTADDVLAEVRKLASEYPDATYSGPCSYVVGYAGPGRGCLIGQALRRLGFTKEQLDNVDDGPASYALRRLNIPTYVFDSWKSVRILDQIQIYQDDGTPWGEAVGI